MLKAHSILKLAAVFIFSSIIIGCGGSGRGGSDSAVTKKGRFLDNAVSGLEYFSGNQFGITDQNGIFIYEDGKNISFFIVCNVCSQKTILCNFF